MNIKNQISVKNQIRNVCGLAVALAFTACSTDSVEGTWVEPVPGMENMMQGIQLEKGGKASSVNMATLVYDHWERQGDKLILSGTSIGNGVSGEFTDTLTIVGCTENELNLKRGEYAINYKRQK